MSRHLNIIGAVFRKDVAALWPMIIIHAVMMLISGVAGIRLSDVPVQFQPMLVIIPVAAFLCSAILCFQVAHRDPVAGSGQDWLTRPIGRIDMVAAKVAFIIATVIVPIFLASLIVDLAWGTGLIEALAYNSTILSLVFLAPVALAVASLTSNLFEALAAGFAVFILAVGGLIFTAVYSLTGAPQISGSGFSWIATNTAYALMLVFAVVILFLLYGRRRVGAARLLAVPAIVLIAFTAYLFPWDAAVAIQRAVTPKRDGPTIRLAPDVQCLRPVTNPQAAAPFAGKAPRLVDARLMIDGAPAGWLVTADSIRTPYSGAPAPSFLSGGLHSFGARTGTRTLNRTLVLPKDNQPVPITATLTLREPVKLLTINLSARTRFYPDFGWCRTFEDREGLNLQCTVLPSVDATRLAYNGVEIPCLTCMGTTPYDSNLLPGRRNWRLPPGAKGQVEARTFRYHSTTVQKSQVSTAAQTDPTRICPDRAPAQAPKAEVSVTVRTSVGGRR